MQWYQTIKWSKTDKTALLSGSAHEAVWLSIFFSGRVETNKPSARVFRIPKTQKPHLPMTSFEAPSHQGITFTVLLMNLSQGFDLNKGCEAAMVRSEMVGLRGKTNLPPTPSLLMEYRIQHHTPTPAEYQSLNHSFYSHNLRADRSRHFGLTMKLSPLCGWSLLSGGRSWETGPTLQRTQSSRSRWLDGEGTPTPTELTAKAAIFWREAFSTSFLGEKLRHDMYSFEGAKEKKNSKILKGKSIWKVIVQTFPISAIIWSFEKRGRLQASK